MMSIKPLNGNYLLLLHHQALRYLRIGTLEVFCNLEARLCLLVTLKHPAKMWRQAVDAESGVRTCVSFQGPGL